MKSDIITIDSRGKGFNDAVDQTKKVAAFEELDAKDTLQFQMLTEEMLSLVRSITGEINASFWIEFEDGQAELHMTTSTVMDKEKRDQLIAASSSRKNEAANTFLGKLRDVIEDALVADPEQIDPPNDIVNDLPFGVYGEEEWDGYESSILRKLADGVKVGIRGDNVYVTVSKRFGE